MVPLALPGLDADSLARPRSPGRLWSLFHPDRKAFGLWTEGEESGELAPWGPAELPPPAPLALHPCLPAAAWAGEGSPLVTILGEHGEEALRTWQVCLAEPPTSLTFSRGGEILFAGTASGRIHAFWMDWEQQRLMTFARLDTPSGQPVASLHLSAHGRFLYVLQENPLRLGTVAWDPAAGGLVQPGHPRACLAFPPLSKPGHLALAPGGTWACLTLEETELVKVIHLDPRDGSISHGPLAVVEGAGSAGLRAAPHPNGRGFLVLDRSESRLHFFGLNPRGGAVPELAPAQPVLSRPVGLGWSRRGDELWIAHGSGILTRWTFSGPGRRLVPSKQIRLPGIPWGVAEAGEGLARLG